MRVGDYITDALYKAGAKTVFILAGGYNLPLTDAVLSHPNQDYVCCLHEQAVAMAADGYGRVSGRLGAAYFIAGPGATNALTGVVDAYLDSVPCVFVSGQQKLSYTKVEGVRQFGFQGFNTIPVVESITKYATLLDDIETIRYEVEKAIYIAKSGRPGPVWIEVPLDIQGMPFDPNRFERFVPPEVKTITNDSEQEKAIQKAAGIIKSSTRPCILAGAGIRMGDAINSLHRFVNRSNIPILTSKNAMDLIDDSHPLFVGRPGLYGCRAANFAVENCDVFIAIGCRLDVLHVGHDYDTFAKQAKKIVVDIDHEELRKPSINPDLSINMDADLFLNLLSQELEDYNLDNPEWTGKINDWKKNYPVTLPQFKNDRDLINTYYFFEEFSKKVSAESNFVLDACSAYYTFPQAFKVKFGQRHITTGNLGTMGFMPAAIGLAKADSERDVYCICGDGSIQMNVQELQTIFHNKLRIKLIVLNNNGYLCIRTTQENLFNSRFIGSNEASGLSLPSIAKVANAYGIKFMRMSSVSELHSQIDKLITSTGPLICEIMMPENQKIIPRVMSEKLADGTMRSMPFDDMYPFLPRDEYHMNHNFFRTKEK